jgi:hypothetical protein
LKVNDTNVTNGASVVENDRIQVVICAADHYNSTRSFRLHYGNQSSIGSVSTPKIPFYSGVVGGLSDRESVTAAIHVIRAINSVHVTS